MFRKKRKSIFILSMMVLFFAVILNQVSLFSTSEPPEFAESAENIVYYVPQFTDFEEISIHEMHFLKQILKEAKENNVKAVIFEIDTPGGNVGVALKYISILSKAEVPTIAFVNPQAISAGMIIALAADRIAISPNGTIGDAMPLQVTSQGVRPITDKPPNNEPEHKDSVNDKKDIKKLPEKTKSESKEKQNESKIKPDQPAEPVAEKADKKVAAKEENGDVVKSDSKKSEKKSEKEKKDKQVPLKKLLKKFQNLSDSQKLTQEDKRLADQKFLTVFFKVLQVLAEKNDRPVKIIRAMADPYQKLSKKEDGIEHTKVSPLTLSAVEAKRLGVVDYLCRNKSELKKQLGLSNCKLVIKNKTPVHYIIFFLANPFISGLLIVLGVIGLYVEAKTPGFGVAGGIGVAALILFFIGHMGIGDSNWVPTVIFFIGIILLALEIFVIPGFGITGIAGIIAIFASLLLAFGWDNIELAINTVGIAMIVAVIVMVFLTIYVLPKSKLFKKITLETAHTSEDGFESHERLDKNLINKEGTVHTILRPAGVVFIDGKRLDVVTEGDFIEKGEKIKIIRIDGMRIIVEKIS